MQYAEWTFLKKFVLNYVPNTYAFELLFQCFEYSKLFKTLNESRYVLAYKQNCHLNFNSTNCAGSPWYTNAPARAT